MENNKSLFLAQFFAGTFGGAILGIAGFIVLANIGLLEFTALISILTISVVLGIILGIAVANKTKITLYSRIIPWLGIGFFILPPVLLVGALYVRLIPPLGDPVFLYFMFVFMIGIMATSLVLSAITVGLTKLSKSLEK